MALKVNVPPRIYFDDDNVQESDGIYFINDVADFGEPLDESNTVVLLQGFHLEYGKRHHVGRVRAGAIPTTGVDGSKVPYEVQLTMEDDSEHTFDPAKSWVQAIIVTET